jgi:hypothetical protein
MGDDSPILASDAERAQSIVLLRDAVTSGRLTLEEFSERVGSRRHAVRALARAGRRAHAFQAGRRAQPVTANAFEVPIARPCPSSAWTRNVLEP